MRISLIFIFIIIVQVSFGQKESKGIYNTLDEAIVDSALVKNLYIDFNLEEEPVFTEKIGSFINLHSITIVNFEQKEFPSAFYNLKELDSIIIADCPKLNYRLFFKNLVNLQSLTYLELDGNDLRELPIEVNSVNTLKTLRITNNENLLLSETVEILQKSPSLTELALPVNDITELPDNIGTLKQIKVLDLSNNYLTDLPDSIAGMSSLIRIRLEGNNLVDPVNTTEKMKGLDIKYISLDNSLTSEEKSRLQTIFPDCEIKEINASITPGTLTQKDTPLLNTSNIPDITISNKATKDSVNYGTFQIEQSDFVAFSTSYLHYPALLRNPLLKVEFDSLLFDERYLDTNYNNTSKINPNPRQSEPFSFSNLKLELVKAETKKGIWFKFLYSELNSEINAFNRVPWVYTGELSKKKFKKTYIRNTSWNDIRFYYDDAEKMFTVELKGRHKFTRFTAYPVNANSKIPLQVFQLKYAKLYASYCKALDRRRKRFHKILFGNKMVIEKNYKKNQERLWNSFRDMYMSPDEKKMTIDEWLKYYDKVIAHEKKTLYAATANELNIKRSLELNTFELLTQSEWIGKNNCTNTLNASFDDKAGNNLPVTSIIIIDKENRYFYSVSGSVGLSEQMIMLCNDRDIRIIVEMRNGDIGIVPPEDLADKNLFKDKKKRFVVQTIPKNLCTVGQVMELIGL